MSLINVPMWRMLAAAVAAVLVGVVEGKGSVIEWDADAALEDAPPPMPLVAVDELPKSFSWRRIAGYGSLLTPSLNQHVPQYCGACFAFGSFSTLQDRVKIGRYLSLRSGEAQTFDGPDLVAAIQVMLNCGGEDHGWGVAGSCSTGGSSSGVYRWVKAFGGIPAGTCFPYLAEDGLGCAPDTICRNCMPKSLEPGAGAECWAVRGDAPDDPTCVGRFACASMPYPRMSVGAHGKLPSAHKVGAQEAARLMQVEIARGGPISCNVDALPFLSYQGDGLVDENPPNGRTSNATDHIIEVVGWGEMDDGTPFWEIRNSWGEYWGDNSFAKVRRGVDDSLVESGCTWVHPDGWGVPGFAWHDNDLGAHDAQAADLVALHGDSRPTPDLRGWPATKSLVHVLYAATPVLGVALIAAFALKKRPAATGLL